MTKVTLTAVPLNVPQAPGLFPFMNLPKIKVKVEKRKGEKDECLAQRWVSKCETISGIFAGISVGAAARKSKANLYGALVGAGVTCVGGSTVYSLLRNKRPAWVSSPAFLAKCLVAGGVGYYGLFRGSLARPWVAKVARGADLVALGGAAVAAGKELAAGKGNLVTAALSASLGAVGGGLCWDLVERRYPAALKPAARALVVPPILGAWAYPLFHNPHHPNAAVVFTVATTIGLHNAISKKKKK